MDRNANILTIDQPIVCHAGGFTIELSNRSNGFLANYYVQVENGHGTGATLASDLCQGFPDEASARNYARRIVKLAAEGLRDEEILARLNEAMTAVLDATAAVVDAGDVELARRQRIAELQDEARAAAAISDFEVSDRECREIGVKIRNLMTPAELADRERRNERIAGEIRERRQRANKAEIRASRRAKQNMRQQLQRAHQQRLNDDEGVVRQPSPAALAAARRLFGHIPEGVKVTTRNGRTVVA